MKCNTMQFYISFFLFYVPVVCVKSVQGHIFPTFQFFFKTPFYKKKQETTVKQRDNVFSKQYFYTLFPIRTIKDFILFFSLFFFSPPLFSISPNRQKKKKKAPQPRLCANFCPLSRDFWIFLWCVFFLQTGVSLRKPENLIFHSKGTLECFHTHM